MPDRILISYYYKIWLLFLYCSVIKHIIKLHVTYIFAPHYLSSFILLYNFNHLFFLNFLCKFKICRKKIKYERIKNLYLSLIILIYVLNKIVCQNSSFILKSPEQFKTCLTDIGHNLIVSMCLNFYALFYLYVLLEN